MKINQYITTIFCIIFLGFFSKILGQDLENEMFINRNSIDNKFVQNSNTEKLFLNKNKDEIQVILKPENDSVFSVFIRNNMNKILDVNPQDNSLYIIQEALDQNKNWKPIEFWGYSTCGNSYDNYIKFKPKEIIHLTTEKYKGKYKTQVRIKLLMNKKKYYSNPINSEINISKFDKSKWFTELSGLIKGKTEKEIENIYFLDVIP
ncbi:hypothetical protein [Elizabethkingia anophelis]|uniref:hypothetical protein n=1 Tax=Elizabethkingia anophelis TaxID=1117645 RepID=UPI000442AF9E|nr:hypothetical protein [Elizabethkingia anophelis]CDN76565.1 hypothetical protein E18064_730001 [Elizabethkingia anophelis]CDN79385.1 hypothetical protein E27107_530013 [Elizabethkingia anophelis]